MNQSGENWLFLCQYLCYYISYYSLSTCTSVSNFTKLFSTKLFEEVSAEFLGFHCLQVIKEKAIKMVLTWVAEEVVDSLKR